MNASTEIRQYAAKMASTNPSIAFDLMHLADKVAQQENKQENKQGDEAQGQQKKQAQQDKKQQQAEQGDDAQAKTQQKQAYTALRSAIIRTAKTNPMTRQALQPVLRLIQQLG